MSIESITKSLEATFRNYTLDTDKIDWKCPETGPIKEILYKNSTSRAADFTLEEKIKKKGRKPKPRQASAPISDLTFNLRRETHRRVKKDTYSRTSQDCAEHEDCEIIFKTYNVSIFGKGKIVCVGITEENCEDFNWCIKIITDFLISKGYEPHDLEVIKINKTLENFKFRLKDEERKIDLIAINNFFVNNYLNGEIANVEIDRLLLYFIKKIKTGDLEFCPKSMIKKFDEFSELKHFLIHKTDLLDFLNGIDLVRINGEIERIYNNLSTKHTNILNYELDMFLKKIVIRSYINYHCIDLLRKCTRNSYKVAKNVSLDNDKNTIEILITVNSKDITVKLFSSGKVNILGAKNVEQIQCIYSNLEKLLDENPGIIYHTDDY